MTRRKTVRVGNFIRLEDLRTKPRRPLPERIRAIIALAPETRCVCGHLPNQHVFNGAEGCCAPSAGPGFADEYADFTPGERLCACRRFKLPPELDRSPR